MNCYIQVFLQPNMNFNWGVTTTPAVTLGNIIAAYASKPAQLLVNTNQVFVSTIDGDNPANPLNVTAMRAAAGVPVFFAPGFTPSHGLFGYIDGAFNGVAWDTNGRARAPDGFGDITVAQGDQSYQNILGSKPYIAPVSPWFSTRE
jgi:hypothetical protein